MKSKDCAPMQQHRKALIDKIKQLGQVHSVWNVFEHFLALSAISISNAVDQIHFEEREKQYFNIINQYSKQELDLFPSMLADLVMELESFADHPQDVLGEIFHELELHDKYKGQFFTPNCISNLMGSISISEKEKMIDENGYVTLNEPCSGSGTLVLGFANAMRNKKYNYQKQLLVTAVDVEIKCVYMTYIQLALYGIPAVVVHGDTIAVKEWSHWYTPMYIANGFKFQNRVLTEPFDKSKLYHEMPAMQTIKSYGQISLF